jgi:hypothetical protein
MLVFDIDYYSSSYEVDKDSKIVFIADGKPQTVTVNEDVFRLPLNPITSTFSWDIIEKDYFYRMVEHVKDHHITCMQNEDVAKTYFDNLRIPFSFLNISKPGMKSLKFAIAEPEFLGVFVGRTEKTAPIKQAGAFMRLDYITLVDDMLDKKREDKYPYATSPFPKAMVIKHPFPQTTIKPPFPQKYGK